MSKRLFVVTVGSQNSPASVQDLESEKARVEKQLGAAQAATAVITVPHGNEAYEIGRIYKDGFSFEQIFKSFESGLITDERAKEMLGLE
jgi:hypothetical protein